MTANRRSRRRWAAREARSPAESLVPVTTAEGRLEVGWLKV
jgi:hypothetical protein